MLNNKKKYYLIKFILYFIIFNVFYNVDAVLGIVILICLPLGSLISINISKNTDFWSYAFPLISIALAGIYDAYGRYEKNSSKNFKLCIRVILDTLAIFFGAYFSNVNLIWKHYIPSIILLFSGIMLLSEAINRIKTAIEISPWYIKFK